MSQSALQASTRLFVSGCTDTMYSGQCPGDMASCPKFMLPNPGPKCATYMLESQKSAYDRLAFDSAKLNYCLEKYDASGQIPPECACVLRNEDPDYVAAISKASERGMSKEDDQCWYLPCRDPITTILPSNMLEDEDPRSVTYAGCTGVTCSQLVDARGAEIGVAFIEQKTGCTNEVNRGDKDDDKNGSKKPKKKTTTVGGWSDWAQSLPQGAWLAFVAMLVVVVLLLVVF